MGDVKDYISVAEAAARLGLSKARIHQLIKAGKLAVAEWVSNMRLVLAADVEAFKPRVHGKPGRPKTKPAPPPAKPRGRRT